MNCRSCGYPLWTIAGRTCPECGTGFAPSEFVFSPGSVRFCCPHCDQQYFGTDLKGHLVPVEFDCVRCRRRIAMDETVVRGIGEAGAPEDLPRGIAAPQGARPDERPEMPWFEREKLGLVKAWLRTAGRAMTRPTTIIAAVPEEASAGSALLFALMNCVVFYVLGTIPALFLSMALGQFAPMGGLLPMWAQLAASAGGFVLQLVALWIWFMLTHLLLRLFGAASRPAARTWHALGYASAAGALLAVPFGCLGTAGYVWWTVAAILMLAAAQRCSVGKAAAATLVAGCIATLLPLSLWIATVFGFMVVPVWNAGGMTLSGTALPGPPLSSGPLRLGMALGNAADRGAWPDHALQLVDDGIVLGAFADDFMPAASDRVAGAPALDVLQDSPEALAAALRDAPAALPQGVIGHRVGDWMFVYHGVPTRPTRPGRNSLWLAVLAPTVDEGDENPVATFTVIDHDLFPATHPITAWQAMIRAQNQAREAAGLPELPTMYSRWRELDVIERRRPAAPAE